MTIKSNINWYKFLSEAANKKSLKEITQHELNQTKMENYLSGKKSSQLDDVFDGKNRFAIPLESETTSNPRDTEMLGYINQLRKSGWTRTEYIEEKKNKIFKLDGATWRIIND
jgi:hypothetical protein